MKISNQAEIAKMAYTIPTQALSCQFMTDKSGCYEVLIPAKAGIQGAVTQNPGLWPWVPAFAGTSGFRIFCGKPVTAFAENALTGIGLDAGNETKGGSHDHLVTTHIAGGRGL